VELYLHSPLTPSWRGDAQLKEKHRDNYKPLHGVVAFRIERLQKCDISIKFTSVGGYLRVPQHIHDLTPVKFLINKTDST